MHAAVVDGHSLIIRGGRSESRQDFRRIAVQAETLDEFRYPNTKLRRNSSAVCLTHFQGRAGVSAGPPKGLRPFPRSHFCGRTG